MGSRSTGKLSLASASPTTSSGRNTVLRVSYARVLETPFNENLVLASWVATIAVLNPLLGCATLGIYAIQSPAGATNSMPGIQQAFGRYLVFSGEYIWKYTHNAYDFSILGATPHHVSHRMAQLEDSRICGTRERAEPPRILGIDGLLQRGGAILHSATRWRGCHAVGAGEEFFASTTMRSST